MILFLDWLLAIAVHKMSRDKALGLSNGNDSGSNPSGNQENPFEHLDFESEEFKAGVAQLATLLSIPPHPDHKQVLRACCILISEKLNKTAIAKANDQAGKVKMEYLSLEASKCDISSGLVPSADEKVTMAVRILRLLYIKELRKLQDGINAAVVKVQQITADPRTDERLGRVGR